jgi:endonuclease/exonuclease/phosphatase (EEP) superfamily protein YafD
MSFEMGSKNARFGEREVEQNSDESTSRAEEKSAPRKIMTFCERTVCVAAAGIGAATLAGLCGRAWFLLELFSHWRTQYVWGLAGCTVLLLAIRRWRAAGVVGLSAVLLGITLLPFYTGRVESEAPRTLRVMQANILYGSDDYAGVLDAVRAADADVVVLLEVTLAWAAELTALSEAYPYSRMRARSGAFGLAVFSRLPVEEWQELEPAGAGAPAILARISVDGRAVNILAAHVFPPVSAGRAAMRNRQMAALAGIARAQTGPVVLLADLNATPWSSHFKRMLRDGVLRDARRGYGVKPTWPTFWPAVLRIPIDHCLITPDIAVQSFRTGPPTGSDHLPIIVDLVLSE